MLIITRVIRIWVPDLKTSDMRLLPQMFRLLSSKFPLILKPTAIIKREFSRGRKTLNLRIILFSDDLMQLTKLKLISLSHEFIPLSLQCHSIQITHSHLQLKLLFMWRLKVSLYWCEINLTICNWTYFRGGKEFFNSLSLLGRVVGRTCVWMHVAWFD